LIQPKGKLAKGSASSIVSTHCASASRYRRGSLKTIREWKISMLVWVRRCAVCAVVLLTIPFAYGRDRDGRYANSPLHDWFEQLSSKKGLCCSDADGMVLSDVDWDSHDGHYRVHIDDEWVDVPEDTVVTEPNKAKVSMVWPIWLNGRPHVRCFMPGSMS
jgi:hypothetical protein